MKDFANPVVLLAVVVLLICRTAMPDVAADCDLWAMVLCFTAFVVDVSLGVARAIMHRPSLMKVVWAMGFLILGSVAFLLPRSSAGELDQDEADLKAAIAVYRETKSCTCEVPGGSALELASALGKVHLVREFLQSVEAKNNKPVLARAMCRAAENGHVAVVQLLVQHADANEPVQGITALATAASHGRVKVVECLLAAGADANLADGDGTVPLIHAVLADSISCVKLLMQYGADPARTDAEGRNAASYSRSEDIDALLVR